MEYIPHADRNKLQAERNGKAAEESSRDRDLAGKRLADLMGAMRERIMTDPDSLPISPVEVLQPAGRFDRKFSKADVIYRQASVKGNFNTHWKIKHVTKGVTLPEAFAKSGSDGLVTVEPRLWTPRREDIIDPSLYNGQPDDPALYQVIDGHALDIPKLNLADTEMVGDKISAILH